MPDAALPFPYVPNYVSEELLFSWVSRLHYLNSPSDPRQTLAKIFRSPNGIPSADLPCRLRAFVDTTGRWGPFRSPDSVATKATLFPYYSLFVSPERGRRILDTMKSDRGDALKIGAGLVANGFGASPTLRSCRSCDRESLKQYGTIVLYRAHQLPSVFICLFHSEPLQQHFVQSRQSFRHCLSTPRNRVLDAIDVDRRCVRRLAELSSEALLLGLPSISAPSRSEAYLSAITQAGFVRKGRIAWESLTTAVRDEYDDFRGLPFRSRLLSSSRHPLRWLHDLCRRPSRSLHPICHLLLIGLVSDSVKEFFASFVVTDDNNLRSSPIWTDAGRSRGSDRAFNAIINDTDLTCRQAAYKVGVSTSTMSKWRRAAGVWVSERRRKATRSRVADIEQLLAQGLPVADVAKATECSATSLYRILASSPNVRRIRSEAIRERTLQRCRSQWLEAISSSSAMPSVKELRSVAGAAYAWLYRNDRAWLATVAVPRKNPRRVAPSTRVNWPARDQALTAVVLMHGQSSVKSATSKRISATMLLRATGTESTARQNIHRLPLLSKALSHCAEQREDFRQRRIAIARAALEELGFSSPPDWRVRRMSRVRH